MPSTCSTRASVPARGRGRWLGVGVAVVVLAAAGLLGPPTSIGVGTDRLGPDQGEAVAEYAARSRDSISGDRFGDRVRWALISLRAEATAAAAADIAVGVRISQILYRVPIERVASPVAAVVVPAGRAAALDSPSRAASQLLALPAADERAARVVAVSAGRLRAGCACVVGLVVDATTAQLRDIAGRGLVRTVEALPPDAVAEHFGVTPLTPDQADRALPSPDDGPVPPN